MKTLKKVMYAVLVAVLVVPFALVMSACSGKTYNVSTVAELTETLKTAENGAKIVLQENLDISSPIVIDKKITLDLNGKTISNSNDLWNDVDGIDDWSLISVRATVDKKGNVVSKGDLTIIGDGSLLAKENDCYAVDVMDGAKLTIESGTFVGNIHAVYVFEGSLVVKGGKYSVQQKYTVAGKEDEFVLNCYDQNRKDGTATIVVYGGEFEKFNPANCAAEGENTNFVAEGYKTEQTGDVYTVVRA